MSSASALERHTRSPRRSRPWKPVRIRWRGDHATAYFMAVPHEGQQAIERSGSAGLPDTARGRRLRPGGSAPPGCRHRPLTTPRRRRSPGPPARQRVRAASGRSLLRRPVSAVQYRAGRRASGYGPRRSHHCSLREPPSASATVTAGLPSGTGPFGACDPRSFPVPLLCPLRRSAGIRAATHPDPWVALSTRTQQYPRGTGASPSASSTVNVQRRTAR